MVGASASSLGSTPLALWEAHPSRRPDVLSPPTRRPLATPPHRPDPTRIPQGHTSPITCIVTTEDRANVVTADMGPESLLVVWNVRTGLPLRTVSSPHRHGVSTMDVSADGAWLATVSAADPDTGEQEVGRGRGNALRGRQQRGRLVAYYATSLNADGILPARKGLLWAGGQQ